MSEDWFFYVAYVLSRAAGASFAAMIVAGGLAIAAGILRKEQAATVLFNIAKVACALLIVILSLLIAGGAIDYVF